MLGDLYYRDMGATEVRIIGQRSRTETNMLNLSNDAKLAAAEELGVPAEIAVEASGTVRDDLLVGETGVLSYADLYRVFPLGENPMDRLESAIRCAEILALDLPSIKAALEVGVSAGYVDDSFYLSASGLFVEYDTSRDPQDLQRRRQLVRSILRTAGFHWCIVLDIDKFSGTLDETDIAIFDRARPGERKRGTAPPGTYINTLVFGGDHALHRVASPMTTVSPLFDEDGGQGVDLVDTILTRG